MAGICEFSTKSHRSVLLYQCRRGRPSAACRKHMVGSSSRAAVQPSSCGSKTRTWPSRIGTTRWTSAALAATRPQSMRRAGVPARRTCPDRLRLVCRVCPRRRRAQESTCGRDVHAQLLRAERGARRAPHKSLCDFCRRPHAAGHAGRPAMDVLRALAVLHAHAC